MYQLGGHALFLSKNDIQLGRGEPISDMAQVMSRYLDGIMIRTFGHDNVVELARYASIPVINGLSDLAHPCQVLADYQTLYEQKGELKGLKLAYIGDGNNMAHSLLIGGRSLECMCRLQVQLDTSLTRVWSQLPVKLPNRQVVRSL